MPQRPRGRVDAEFFSLFNLGARWGYVVSTTRWPLYHWERPGTVCIGGWVILSVRLDGVCQLSVCYIEGLIKTQKSKFNS